MNIDQLLEYVADLKVDVHTILQQSIFEFAKHFDDNINKDIDIQGFVGYFVRLSNESGAYAVALVANLIALYEEMARSENVRVLKLKHITDWLAMNFNCDVQSVFLNAKFIPKMSNALKPMRELLEEELNPPEILGMCQYMLKRLEQQSKIVDIHSKRVIIQAIPANDQELLILTQFSESIQLFKGFQFVKDIKPVKVSEGNYIIAIQWSQRQRRIGAILRNYSLIFWERRDSYTFDFQIPNTVELTRLYYLQLQDVWVSLNKKNTLQIWNMSELSGIPLQNECLDSGIVAILEVPHLQMTLIGVAPNIISCWDMYEKVLLFKFKTQHVTLHQMAFSQQFQLVFTVGFDKHILCYQLHTRYNDQNLVCRFEGHTMTVSFIEVIESTALLVSIDCKNTIILWDIRTHSKHQQINLETRVLAKQLFKYKDTICFINNKLHCIAFEQLENTIKYYKPQQVIFDQWNCRNIIVTRFDIRVQNLHNGKVDYILSDFNEEISAACLIEQGSSLIIGTHEGHLKKILLRDGEVLQEWKSIMQSEIIMISFDNNAKLLHVMSNDSTLKAIALIHLNVRMDEIPFKDKRAIRQLIHLNSITQVSISEFHGLLAIGYDDCMEIWNLEHYTVAVRIHLEDEAQVSAMKFCEGLPLLIVATTSGDVFFISVICRNERYICSIEGHLNIVKATLIKKVISENHGKIDRSKMVSTLFALTSEKLIELYDDKEQSIEFKQLINNKYKLITRGSYVTSLQIDMDQDRLTLYTASNHGVAQIYDVSELFMQQTIHTIEPIHIKTNYNPYRVVYNEYNDNYVEHYIILAKRLIKDVSQKQCISPTSKAKMKFRIGRTRLSQLKNIPDEIDDIPNSTVDMMCQFNDKLLQTERIHQDQVTQLTMISVDNFEVFYSNKSIYLLSASLDDSIKILNTNLVLLGHLNINDPNPPHWSNLINDVNKSKTLVLFAIDLINSIMPSLSSDQQYAFSIDNIIKELAVKNLKAKSNRIHRKKIETILLRKGMPKQTNQGLVRNTLPLLSQTPQSLRYLQEKLKVTHQHEQQAKLEKVNDLQTRKRKLVFEQEELRKQKRDLLEYLSPEVKEPNEDVSDTLESRLMTLESRVKTERSQLTLTKFTSVVSDKRLKTQTSRQSHDFFEYAEQKHLQKDSISTAHSGMCRTQHKQFHKILNALHGKLKIFKGK